MEPAKEINAVCEEVLAGAEWISIATSDGVSPHLVATWGDHVTIYGKKTFLIPAGGYHRTEENLKRNGEVQLFAVTRKVKRPDGSIGQGCLIYGKGAVQTEGKFAREIKKKYPWARGALIVKIIKIDGVQYLPKYVILLCLTGRVADANGSRIFITF